MSTVGGVALLLPGLAFLALFNAMLTRWPRGHPREQAIAFPLHDTDHRRTAARSAQGLDRQAWTMIRAKYTPSAGPALAYEVPMLWIVAPPRWRRWWLVSEGVRRDREASSYSRRRGSARRRRCCARVTWDLEQLRPEATKHRLMLTFEAQAGHWLSWASGALVLVWLSAPPYSGPCPWLCTRWRELAWAGRPLLGNQSPTS